MYPWTRRISGSAVLVLALILAACSAGAQEGDAKGLIENWIEAIGGMDNYHRFQSATFTLTTEMWDAESGRLRRTRPRYVWIQRDAQGQHARVERWEGDNFIAHGWNPTGQWASLNGTDLAEGDKDYDEADYVGGDVNYWVGLPYKLLDSGVNLDSEGVNADGLHVVRVTFGENVGDHQDVWRYYFEDGQAWPARVEYIEAGRTNVNRNWWKDVQEVDGYFYVGRRVYFDEQERVTKVIHMSDLVVNPTIAPALFQRP